MKLKKKTSFTLSIQAHYLYTEVSLLIAFFKILNTFHPFLSKSDILEAIQQSVYYFYISYIQIIVIQKSTM